MASGSGVSGDFAKLARLQARLARLPVSLQRRATIACAQEIRTLVALGFRKSVAPDGTKWAPLKVRNGKPLEDTGRLKNSFTTQIDPTRGRIEVGTNVEYANIHQEGTKNVPARPMLPAENELPDRWARPLRETINEAAEEESELMPK